MNLTVFTRRAAVAAVAAVAASTIAVAPANAIVGWGSIAYARDGSYASWSANFPTQTEAEQAAIQQCGSSYCKPLTTFTDCGAVARNSTTLQGGRGATLAQAEARALKLIHDPSAYIDTWACNG